jgi:hypothetical protein
VPAGLAAVAVAALLLPWWRAAAGPVLLGGGPLRALAADSWTGIEVTGERALVVATLAVAAVVAGALRAATGGRACLAATGAAAATCGVTALVGWGPTGAPGAWVAAAAGIATVAGALVRSAGARIVLAVAVLAAAGTLAVPEGEPLPDRTPVGPFLRVAALGSWPLRSGVAGLDSPGGARPVVVDGAPGVLAADGVIVADARGRARVLARTKDGAPPPLGVAGNRVARWITADTLAVTELREGGPLEVVVRDVGAASVVGDDGSVWLRSDIDPPETVRRLGLAVYDGRQDLSATYLPVVTIQNPDGEGPIDVHDVLPVPGGAVRMKDLEGVRQLQLLSSTAAGIAVRPLTTLTTPSCSTPTVSGTGYITTVAADATGVWFPTDGYSRLGHLAPDGTVRMVAAQLPGQVEALAAPGDGSVLFISRNVLRDEDGDSLWRLPDATAALTDPLPSC